MPDELLVVQTNKPRSNPVRIIDGQATTGYRLRESAPPDFGLPSWDVFYSGARGTLGAVSAGAEMQNRQLTLPVQVDGVSQDDLQVKLAALWRIDDELRRFGGLITFRPKGGSFKIYYDVLGSSIKADFDGNYFRLFQVNVTWAPVCAPYVQGDPYDIYDGFDTDTTADYTKDADAAGFVIKQGTIQPTTTGTSRWRHTARGYQYGDQEATLKITTGSTVTSYDANLFICADTTGLDSSFAVRLNGGNLNITKWVNGTPTNLASTAFSLSTTTNYWIRIRREGRLITVGAYTAAPTPLTSPSASTGYVLTIQEAARVAGHAGFKIAVVATGERYDDFRVEPYTYQMTPPEDRPLRLSVIGDAPPLSDVSVDATQAEPFGMVGWWQRPLVWNMVWNGDFEDDVDGWVVTAVTGVTGAATSITRDTTAARVKYGTGDGQIGFPATANTGATFRINRRFTRGNTYQLVLWVSSASQTTTARARLGVNGDIASSSAVALSTTPSPHFVTWTPAATVDFAYACFEITAATLTTGNIDAVVVCEARSVGLTNDIISTTATFAVIDYLPEDWPAFPWLALIDSEIVRADSFDPATNRLTISRGMEGSTAASHTGGSAVVTPLPTIRSHYEGKGAQPPVGPIEAESDDTGNRFTWSLVSTVGFRGGSLLRASSISGNGSAASDILVDPHLLFLDDYTQGEIAIDVWGRIELNSGLTSPVAILSAAPESATVSSGVITSNFGAIRYSEEYGAAGKPLVKPSSGTVTRFVRLGTIRFPVDRNNPLRWRLQARVTWTGASSGQVGLDYLVCVPSLQRALSPTGKPNDGTYPKFIASSTETTKIVRADLSGLVAKPSTFVQPTTYQPDHGLGGSLIELPVGVLDHVTKMDTLVPDDPTVDTTSDSEPGVHAVHFAVTPRWSLNRSS